MLYLSTPSEDFLLQCKRRINSHSLKIKFMALLDERTESNITLAFALENHPDRKRVRCCATTTASKWNRWILSKCGRTPTLKTPNIKKWRSQILSKDLSNLTLSAECHNMTSSFLRIWFCILMGHCIVCVSHGGLHSLIKLHSIDKFFLSVLLLSL